MKTASYRHTPGRALFACVAALVCALAVPGTVSAQASSVPDNAYATKTSYGKGWECRRGFRERDNKCVAFEVPENAHLNYRGDRWECQRGYRAENGACKLIAVPENAFLTDQGYGGIGWTCERGYLAKGKRCEKILVPKHAFLTGSSYGSGWECERGYRATQGECLPVAVPKNAHLGYDGDTWECNEPLIRRGDTCVPE